MAANMMVAMKINEDVQEVQDNGDDGEDSVDDIDHSDAAADDDSIMGARDRPDYTVPTTDSSTMTRLSYKETLKRQQFLDAQKHELNEPIDYDDPETFNIDCE